MSVIQQLDPHVADLIAAGEVVERPASVVKELLENAIDAGASAVTVEISHGGMALIRVTDNGKGIPEDQVATAFLRHATSKISGPDDLAAIGTLGFRGEALAAIAAVSRVEAFTKTEDSPMGSVLTLEGGGLISQEEAGCPNGVTMVVRDLFFNTPARLKFMKKDMAEGAAVFACVQRIALSNPALSVKFIRDGRQELLTPGDGQLKSAVYSVMGRDVALGLTEVKASGEDGIGVHGFVSLPACCRASRSYQHFFVNGRYVKSKLMLAALEEGYKNQKMVGRFPGCVLHLSLPHSMVDVNVHPAKTEVKFQREQQVFSAIYHAVLAALSGNTLRPKAVIPPARAADELTPNQMGMPLHKPSGSGGLAFRSPAPALTNARPVPPPIPAGWVHRPESSPVHTPAQTAPPEGRTATQRQPAHEIPPAQPIRTPSGFRRVTPLPPEGPPQVAPRFTPPVPEAGPAPVPPIPPRETQPEPWRVAGELFRTYIVVEQGDKALLIDKHAAHERMHFDRLKEAGYQPMVQELLSPVTFTPAPEERAVLLEQTALLEEFGFTVEEFGPAALVVRACPDYLGIGDIEDALLELARRVRVTGSADPAAARDELLHTMACKAAIKGGQANGPAELAEVVEPVMSGAVKYCPHGRPVAIELSKRQLERQFKRT